MHVSQIIRVSGICHALCKGSFPKCIQTCLFNNWSFLLNQFFVEFNHLSKPSLPRAGLLQTPYTTAILECNFCTDTELYIGIISVVRPHHTCWHLRIKRIFWNTFISLCQKLSYRTRGQLARQLGGGGNGSQNSICVCSFQKRLQGLANQLLGVASCRHRNIVVVQIYFLFLLTFVFFKPQG